MREHYAMVEKMIGKPVKDEKAAPVEIPDGSDYLIRLFFSLNRNRKFIVAGMGESISLPLSDGDMLDYLTLHADEMQLWEIDLMRKLDRVYLAAIQEKKKGSE